MVVPWDSQCQFKWKALALSGHLPTWKDIWVFHVAMPLPLDAPFKTFPWRTSVPQNMSLSKRLSECGAVCCPCYVWLEASSVLEGKTLESGAGFVFHFQANKSELGTAAFGLGKEVQWLSAQLPTLQLMPRSGTPGSVACYCNYPFNLDLEMNWPRESSSKDFNLFLC